MKHFIVTGGGSGLGSAISHGLRLSGHRVSSWSLPDVDVRNKKAVVKESACYEQIDGLVNCAGVNYINWFDKIGEDDWDRVMDTNVKGIFLVSQALVEQLRGKIIMNIVSNASHVPMTHSAAYNASKGAAHMLTLQMARELKKTHGITVVGVSPNKLKNTIMSEYIGNRVPELRGWSKEEAEAYQLASLASGEETDPGVCAGFVNFILLNPEMHKFMNGTVLPFGA